MASKTQKKLPLWGNRDAILPFQMIGFQTFPVAEAQETINTFTSLEPRRFWHHLSDGGYGSGNPRYHCPL